MPSKKIIYIILALIIIFGLYLFFSKNKLLDSQKLLGAEPKLYLYTIDGNNSGQLTASIPFTQKSKDVYQLDLALDLNQDAQISAEEVLIKDAPSHLIQNLRNNYWLTDNDKKLSAGTEILLQIKLKKSGASEAPEILQKKVKIEAFEIGDKMGFKQTQDNENLKGAWGIPQVLLNTAQAEGDEVFRQANTPDLAQNFMECAAVSAANSLMSLAGENDVLDKLPEFTGELIEELKTDMKFKNGITLDNMVIGKNAFAQRHNLPISTELKFAPTKEDILAALRSGAAVELSFAFVRSASGRKNTGHVVTLVGASPSQIFVHDSGTPDGTDTLSMFGTVQTPKNTFINVPYPLWDGVAYIDGIVIQNWTEAKRASESYTDAGEAGSEVEMLVINGHYFPKSFFHVANPDECKAGHYHANSPDDIAYGLKDKNSLEIVSMTDPSRRSCGFGKVSEVPVEKVTLSWQQSQALSGHLPN